MAIVKIMKTKRGLGVEQLVMEACGAIKMFSVSPEFVKRQVDSLVADGKLVLSKERQNFIEYVEKA